ncbi:hypothetical protein FA95DRAFT_1585503 [Auriscalpium vulgare]|uniref:Uncharacterized protein n=1 Tax=Auriscalpium vulgare TaxID=40419 RepID=A0ACB8R369_9AGAM|nr:hypothetical protein FA95DRAFT_1585503 [Auriscalpium vulgare]
MLLWIQNALTPQEVRDRIVAGDSEFQRQLVEYLEGAHQGQFINGTLNDVHSQIQDNLERGDSGLDPTCTLPEHPPKICSKHTTSESDKCDICSANKSWWTRMWETADELIFRSNRHKCHAGCTSKKYSSCKSRFPRDVHAATLVDLSTGAVELKHGEAWLNTFNPTLTYLIRCNSDVTSLLSGTAIKSIIAYVTDYITKTPLKTHVIFPKGKRQMEKK